MAELQLDYLFALVDVKDQDDLEAQISVLNTQIQTDRLPKE